MTAIVTSTLQIISDDEFVIGSHRIKFYPGCFVEEVKPVSDGLYWNYITVFYKHIKSIYSDMSSSMCINTSKYKNGVNVLTRQSYENRISKEDYEKCFHLIMGKYREYLRTNRNNSNASMTAIATKLDNIENMVMYAPPNPSGGPMYNEAKTMFIVDAGSIGNTPVPGK